MIDDVVIGVLGLGVSGQAIVTALAGRDHQPAALLDSASGEAAEERAELASRLAPRARVHLGDAAMGGLEGLDWLVVSPGVPRTHPVIRTAQARGVEIVAEVELAWRLGGGATRVIGVTGTNGKTSVTTLLAACLDAPAAGNIGIPLIEVLGGPDPPPLVVAELSSFQLRFADTLACEVGVLLNVAPDHLDWHGDMADYTASKARIWRGARHAVSRRDDPGAEALLSAHAPGAPLTGFRLGPPGDGEVGVERGWIVDAVDGGRTQVVPLAALATGGDPAPHVVANVAAVTAAVRCTGVPSEDLGARLAAFQPGPHRLQVVTEAAGVRWVDDSKATNPHAAAAALSALGTGVWICGGAAKGLDPAELAPLLEGRVRHVLAIGTAARAFVALAESVGVPAENCRTLEVAVDRAAELAQPGDDVLLSPACASTDQFVDYVERGQTFAALARAIVDGVRR